MPHSSGAPLTNWIFSRNKHRISHFSDGGWWCSFLSCLCYCCRKTSRDTLHCASLLQNHGAQLAEFIHIDLCTVWENQSNGKECVRAHLLNQERWQDFFAKWCTVHVKQQAILRSVLGRIVKYFHLIKIPNEPLDWNRGNCMEFCFVSVHVIFLLHHLAPHCQ